MDKRYKVGDKVRIIHNNEGQFYGYAPEMIDFVGKVDTVRKLLDYGVMVEGNDWSWAFESIEQSDGQDMPVKAPIKPVARVKKEKKASLRTRLTKACSTKHGVSSAAMVGIYGKGLPIEEKIYAGQICHSFVRYFYSVSEFYENISAHYRVMNKDLRPSYVKYVNYILNRSPWAKAFLTKSFGVGLRYNIVLDCSLPRQHIMAAITALRMGSEFPEHLKLFTEMAKKYGEDFAFIIAATTREANSDNGIVYSLSMYGEAHAVFDVSTCYENLVRFFKEGFPVSKEKAWKEGHDKGAPFNINAMVHYKNKGERSSGPATRNTLTSSKIGWSVCRVFTPENLEKEVEYWKTL